MKRLLIAALLVTLVGCTNGAFTPTPEAVEAEQAKIARRSAARVRLFVQCMELAAKMPRHSDDNVAEVVQECSTQAWYMAQHTQ